MYKINLSYQCYGAVVSELCPGLVQAAVDVTIFLAARVGVHTD